MAGVEQWAEIRRLYFVKRLSIKEIVRRTGHGRNTVRRALRSGESPRYRRPPRPSKLDPFRDEVHRLLRGEPRLPGKRVRELLEEQGYGGGKTILDDYPSPAESSATRGNSRTPITARHRADGRPSIREASGRTSSRPSTTARSGSRSASPRRTRSS